MKLPAIRGNLLRLLPFYAAGLSVASGLKLFYSRAGIDDLDWILAPTATLAELLAGIHFQREPLAGWISHSHRMVLVAGCAGLNFLVIAFSMLFFSFVHRFRTAAARASWLGACLGISFLLTLATNSLRIISAVTLHETDVSSGLATPERVHRAAGTVIYSLSLFLAYITPARIFRRFQVPGGAPGMPSALVPFCWYLAIALGVPLLNRAWREDSRRFLEHSAEVLLICLVLVLSGAAIRTAARAIRGRMAGRKGMKRAA